MNLGLHGLVQAGDEQGGSARCVSSLIASPFPTYSDNSDGNTALF